MQYSEHLKIVQQTFLYQNLKAIHVINNVIHKVKALDDTRVSQEAMHILISVKPLLLLQKVTHLDKFTWYFLYFFRN